MCVGVCAPINLGQHDKNSKQAININRSLQPVGDMVACHHESLSARMFCSVTVGRPLADRTVLCCSDRHTVMINESVAEGLNSLKSLGSAR